MQFVNKIKIQNSLNLSNHKQPFEVIWSQMKLLVQSNDGNGNGDDMVSLDSDLASNSNKKFNFRDWEKPDKH